MIRNMTSAVKNVSDGWVPGDSLAVRVAVVRTTLGMNRVDFAKHCGLIRDSIQSMELGKQVRNLEEKVQAISDATGVDRDWLMFGGPLDSNGPKPVPPPRGKPAPDQKKPQGGASSRDRTEDLRFTRALLYH